MQVVSADPDPYPERVRYVLALPVIAFVVWFAVGAVRGRIQARSCCSLAAEQDGRIAAALREDAARTQG